MTSPHEGVKRESVVLHDEDGFETEDRARAVSAEITQEMEDGTTSRTILRKKDS